MKRTSLKVLLSAMIILSMIPFSLVKADNNSMGIPYFRQIVSFGSTSNGTYVIYDIYFISEYGLNTDDDDLWWQVNSNYAITGGGWSNALIEGDGVEAVLTENQTSGSGSSVANRYRFYFQLDDCSYFHFQVINRNFSFWTTSHIESMASLSAIQSNVSYQSRGTYQNTAANVRKIYNDLHNLLTNGMQISIDLTDIEEILNDVVENQETMIQLLESIANGSSGSTSAESDLDNQIQDTTDLIVDYEDLNSSFESSFDSSQTDVVNIMSSTDLNQFATAMNWYISQLNNLYISMGDMRILVILPLILGIALFIIGRGSVIFRERK